MRFMPAWSKLTAIAHTVPYDLEIMRESARQGPAGFVGVNYGADHCDRRRQEPGMDA